MGSTESAEVVFGRLVRRERERMGLSQAELAEKLSEELADTGTRAHPTTIAKIEARDSEKPRSIRLDEAAALARIFGRSVDEMLAEPTEISRYIAVDRVRRQIHYLTKTLHANSDALNAEFRTLTLTPLPTDTDFDSWSEDDLSALALIMTLGDVNEAVGQVLSAAIAALEMLNLSREQKVEFARRTMENGNRDGQAEA